jgi:uncharacterized membrane protein
LIPHLAELVFPASDFLWPAIGLLLASGSLVILGYRRAPLPPRQKWAAASLKLMGFGLLAFCMLEPVWTGQSVKKGANHFVVLADNSIGMDIIDPAYGMTRSDFLANLLANETKNTWLEQLNDGFKLDRYRFDSKLKRVDDFQTREKPGHASSLFDALRMLATRYNDLPLAGIVVLSDGNASDRPEDLTWLDQLAPIYPVVIGSNKAMQDLALTQVTATQTAFEDAPITIKVDFTAQGCASMPVHVRLLDATGKRVDQQRILPDSDSGPHSVRFRLRPEHPGVSQYYIELELDPPGAEATEHNNHFALTVDQGSEERRILYLSGRPNWEYKFLRRAMEDDAQNHLVGLIRIAKREPKFEFRGREGEAANPLFRGFGQVDEEADFDQPVFVRLNTRGPEELANGFPREAGELFAYDAVVLDDLEAEFFTQDQLNLLDRFVAVRGGGLLMLGGLESFQQGGYDKTMLGKLSPVYLDRQTEEISYKSALWNLTREGWLTPWIRLRETEDDDHRRMEEMPPFKVLNRVHAIKPGARVLVTADVEGTTYPALAVQHYGKGQTGAFLIGDYWRWGFAHESFQADMEKSWRQILRWLVSDVPDRLSVEVLPGGSAQAPHEIRIRALDQAFTPIDQAMVQVKIAQASTNTLTLTALPDADERGVYTVSYMPATNGHYEVEATIKHSDGKVSARTRAGWSVNRNMEEFASLQPDRTTLSMLADQTKGTVLEAENLETLKTLLDQRTMPVMESWSRPAWHTPLFFVLAIGCFISEWAIRRRSALA